MGQKKQSVLLVDDEAVVRNSLSEWLIDDGYDVGIADDGEKALKFLRKEGEYNDAPTPCLILLDLKMPRSDGFEVLETIKADDTMKIIPVIVLTSSDRDLDIERAYQLGCNSYIIKPVNFENFVKAIIDIEHYWLTISELP